MVLTKQGSLLTQQWVALEDDLKEGLIEDQCDTWSCVLWTTALYLAFFAAGHAEATLGPTLLDLSEHLDISVAVAGTFFSCRAVGYFIGATVGGPLLDRTPSPARVLASSVTVNALLTASLPYVADYPLASLINVSHGALVGLMDSGGNVLLLTVWRGSKYTKAAMYVFHFLFGFGAFVAPMSVSFLVRFGESPSQAWVAAGAFYLPACIGFAMLAWRTQPKPSDQHGPKGLLDPVVVLAGAFLCADVGMEVAAGGYIDSFAVRRLGAPAAQAAELNAAYWGNLALSGLLAAVITPYVNHIHFILVHLLLAWLAMAALAFLGNQAGAGVDNIVLAATALYGFALGPLFPGAILVAEELLAPRRLDGRAAGFLIACAALGEMVLPLGTGVCFNMDPGTFPWFQLAVCTAAVLCFASVSWVGH